MNGIIKKIIDSKTVENGDKVIVGFSGGPDSLTLLHALNSAKEELGISIYGFILIIRLDLWTAMLRQNMLDAYA